MKLKSLTSGLGASVVVSVIALADGVNAATFTFSFMNVDGLVDGTVEGTVELPDGDGSFVATAVTITSFPAALGLPPAPIDALAVNVIENQFSVVGGTIDIADTSFIGLINGSVALSLSNSIADGSTFLDASSGGNSGATGVRDADNSTLFFSSDTVVSTPEPTSIFMLAGLGILGMTTKLKKKA